MKIQILSASIPGTAHTLPGSPKWKNNQDAYAFLELPHNECVAVVCDGCSSGEHSEVGAVLAAQHLVKLVATEVYMRNGALANIPWEQIKSRLISYLLSVAEGIDMEGSLMTVVENYFLFTIVGVIVTQKEIYFFNIGDGYYALDKKFSSLGPFSENKPPYLMYNFTGSPVLKENPKLSNFQIKRFPAENIKTVMVGCDGVEDLLAAHREQKCFPGTAKPVGPLERLFAPEFFSNPDNLRRHLALMNGEKIDENRRIIPGLLMDDTTIVAIRMVRDGNQTTNPKDHKEECGK